MTEFYDVVTIQPFGKQGYEVKLDYPMAFFVGSEVTIKNPTGIVEYVVHQVLKDVESVNANSIRYTGKLLLFCDQLPEVVVEQRRVRNTRWDGCRGGF